MNHLEFKPVLFSEPFAPSRTLKCRGISEDGGWVVPLGSVPKPRRTIDQCPMGPIFVRVVFYRNDDLLTYLKFCGAPFSCSCIGQQVSSNPMSFYSHLQILCCPKNWISAPNDHDLGDPLTFHQPGKHGNKGITLPKTTMEGCQKIWRIRQS